MVLFIGYSEALFAVGVAVMVIIPRPASSVDWIGGDLSAPFRTSVFVLTLLNVFRNVSYDDRRFRDVCPSPDESTQTLDGSFWTFSYYILTSFESFSHAFLMLLMPYLLQKRLSEVINITPGRDLMPWLQAILFLNLLGIVTAPYNPNLWAFKRFGDALGCIPVIKTLQLFRRINSNSAEQGNHMTIKTLEALEGYSLFVTIMAAAAYLTDDHRSSVLNVAIRVGSIFVSGLRTMFHGHLLNVMDDASYVPPMRTSAPQQYERESVDLDTVVGDESRDLIVRAR